MFVEVVIGIVCFISLLNLVISWINLNLQIELKDGLIEFMKQSQRPTGEIRTVVQRIDSIHDFLEQLMNVMGNPFQMLAATHGARILDRIFPPKIQGVGVDDQETGVRSSENDPLLQEDWGHDDISNQTQSGTSWQDAEQNQNAEEVEEAQESN